MTKKGFTLIEILIVVVIIGVLAAVVLISLDSAQAKARDTRRLSDLNELANAFRMYYEKNNTYVISDAGPMSGYAHQGWLNCNTTCGGYSAKTLDQALVEMNLISAPIDDPMCKLPTTTADLGTKQFCYAVYFQDKAKLSLFAHLEKATQEQLDDSMKKAAYVTFPVDGDNEVEDILDGYKLNYANTIIP